MRRIKEWSACLVTGLAVCVAAGGAWATGVKPPEKPADIRISVSPDAARAGGDVLVRLQLAPVDGIKINRYPKIKLTVPEQAGLTAGAEASTGNDRPPPPGGDPESNYFKKVDPVEMRLALDPSIPDGRHEIEGKLVYAYCVAASGFCTRTRVPVKIPVTVDPS